MSGKKLTGKVKWFNGAKGYGFIVPQGGGDEGFVHYSAINTDKEYKNLREDDRVEYDLVDVGKGPQARNVKVVS